MFQNSFWNYHHRLIVAKINEQYFMFRISVWGNMMFALFSMVDLTCVRIVGSSPNERSFRGPGGVGRGLDLG